MILTQKAQEKLDDLIGEDEYFLISLDGGGCAGLMLHLDRTKLLPSTALNIKKTTNAYFACSTTSKYLTGGTLDWTDDVMSAGFNVKLPAGTQSCGCGASIQMEKNHG
jgi:iron-sulfur cluster assembly protein